MAKERKQRNLVAATAAVTAFAAAAFAVNCAVSAAKARFNGRKRKGLPGSNVRINLSSSEISALADHVIAKSKRTYDLVASIPIDKVTYANTISPLADLEAVLFPLTQSCIFPKMVSTSDDVRRASGEAEKKLDLHFLESRKREDVYRVIKAFTEKGERLSPEVKRFVECLVRDFERNGVLLSFKKRKELQSLKSQIDELELQYVGNLNNDSTSLLFHESELDGMPFEFIKSLEKSENGKLKVPIRSNYVSPILEYCKIGATRKLVALTHGQRCGSENLHILEKLVHLRHRIAELLGYSSYADYVIEPRMPKSSAKVFEFLEDISHILSDIAARELDLLKDLKQKEEGTSQFGTQDMLYYMRKAEEQCLDMNVGVVNLRFPVNFVVSGLLENFQDLFGLRFDEIADVEVWHDSVRAFAVYNSSGSELLGYFYLDIFSRKGKYAHTCVLALQNGCLLSTGACQVPVVLLLSQIPEPNDIDPALLRFSEVVSIFHEFGHVVHQICSRASFSRLSGLMLEADFIEIFGQMVENWCYDSGCLRLLSGLNQEVSESITVEMCKYLKRKRDSFAGLKLKQEILLCLVDQIIHSSENIDITQLVKHLHPKVMLGIPLLEGVNPASCFPSLGVGHEASCYHYLWSEVFASDIFSAKFERDPMNKSTGLHFQNKVFAPGGGRDPTEILTDYLGRDPSINAFVEKKTQNSFERRFSR